MRSALWAFLASSLVSWRAHSEPADLEAEFAFLEVARREFAPPAAVPGDVRRVRPGYEWKPAAPWVWLIAEVTAPAQVGGLATAGHPLGLRVSCAQGGAVYLDGRIRSRFDNDKPALVLLSEAVRPGEHFRLAIHAETRGGGDQVRFSEARWELLPAERVRQPLELAIDTARQGEKVPDGIVGLSQGGTMADYEDATAACLKEGGFKWFRMDNVLTSCVREKEGRLTHDFTELDRRLDFIAKVGALPILAASYMPQPLDAVPDKDRHSAPRDYGLWETLCYEAELPPHAVALIEVSPAF